MSDVNKPLSGGEKMAMAICLLCLFWSVMSFGAGVLVGGTAGAIYWLASPVWICAAMLTGMSVEINVKKVPS